MSIFSRKPKFNRTELPRVGEKFEPILGDPDLGHDVVYRQSSDYASYKIKFYGMAYLVYTECLDIVKSVEKC